MVNIVTIGDPPPLVSNEVAQAILANGRSRIIMRSTDPGTAEKVAASVGVHDPNIRAGV